MRFLNETILDRFNANLKVYPTNITSDSNDIVKLQVLSMLLSRGQASPLYKALVESGLVQLLSPLQG